MPPGPPGQAGALGRRPGAFGLLKSFPRKKRLTVKRGKKCEKDTGASGAEGGASPAVETGPSGAEGQAGNVLAFFQKLW